MLPQLLLYNMVPDLLELFQLPKAWIGEELGQEGELATGWRPVVPPLQLREDWAAIPHPEKGKYIQDLDGPVVPGLQQVLDTVMNAMYQSAVLPEHEGKL